MRRRTSFLAVVLAVLGFALARAGASEASAATSPGVIAYVAGAKSQEIHLINPDGGNDRRILAVSNAFSGISSLAWRPDSAELAFASDHEAATSLYDSDIYAVRPDGSGLRRLTNGPDTSQLAAYPKGTVTVDVQVYNGDGPYIVYVAGAPAPQATTATNGGTQRLTFANVADFGAGRAQFVVAINGQYRWVNAGVAADVQPGKTVYAGKLVVSGSGGVYKADRPSWRSDGSKVGFGFGRGFQPEQVAAHPADGALGDVLISASAIPGFPSVLDWAPVPALANQLLFDSYDFNGESIYRAAEGSNNIGSPLVTFDSSAIDLKWLPDGSGFLAAVEGDFGASANIYEYDFATKQLTQLTHFTNEIAGHLSISPDGQQIVFEHAATLDSPADLWLMNRDGSNMHLLVANAVRPSWSRSAPQLPRRVFVSMIRR